MTAASKSLEEILDGQCQKLADLECATALIKQKDLKDELISTYAELQRMLDTARSNLEAAKKQNDACRKLTSFVVNLDDKIVHMTANVPPELLFLTSPGDGTLSPASQPTVVTEKGSAIKDCKRTLFSQPEHEPTMAPITIEEFNALPKYMIGRQSLKTVNDLIEGINQTLKAKYAFLALGKEHARKQGKMSVFLDYQKQQGELAREKGSVVYFFTGLDYEKQTDSKLTKTKLNLLTVLRHCKRIRQNRYDNDMQYILI